MDDQETTETKLRAEMVRYKGRLEFRPDLETETEKENEDEYDSDTDPAT